MHKLFRPKSIQKVHALTRASTNVISTIVEITHSAIAQSRGYRHVAALYLNDVELHDLPHPARIPGKLRPSRSTSSILSPCTAGTHEMPGYRRQEYILSKEQELSSYVPALPRPPRIHLLGSLTLVTLSSPVRSTLQ